MTLSNLKKQLTQKEAELETAFWAIGKAGYSDRPDAKKEIYLKKFNEVLELRKQIRKLVGR